MTKQNKTLITITSFIAVFIILFSFFFFDYKDSIDKSASDNEELVEFVISEGETTRSIAAGLKKVGLVKNSIYFEIYVRLNALSSKFQAGHYSIPGNVSFLDLGEILQVAYEQDIWITIPEGMMASEIADIIAEEFVQVQDSAFNKNDFIALIESTTHSIDLDLPIPDGKPYEGYLFPDTYRFSQDSTAESVLEAMLSNFKSKIYDNYSGEINDSGYTLYEVLILASILEKETYHTKDRFIVADIMERRLNNDWALEVDATLLYYFQDWEHDIITKDLQIDTPYNTRKYEGLTPTPINNPGEETISAVINPQSNDYWFYVSDKDGNLYYGKTLDEHNQNIQQYLSQ
ncbi:MAG: endolytic transglycosylase MltG [bacterium]